MSAWETDLLSSGVARLFSEKVESHMPALDEDPSRPLPVDLLVSLSEIGIFDAAAYDAVIFSPSSCVELLLSASALCPTYGMLLSTGLLGSQLHRQWGCGSPPSSVAHCAWESGQSAVDAFDTVLADGVITGEKSMVFFAPRAERLAVLGAGRDGPALAWLDPGAPGVSLDACGTLGLRGLGCAHVGFDGTAVLGAAELKTADVVDILDTCSMYATACALGAATRSLSVAREYAAQRYQAGRIIKGHDAVRLMLANSEAAVNSAVSALRSLAAASTEQARQGGAFLRLKSHASRIAVAAASDGVQVLGGYGYMRDYGQERRFRDVCTLMLYPLDPVRSVLWAG